MAGRTQKSQETLSRLKELNPKVTILSILDEAFLRYGRVLTGYRTDGIQQALAARTIAAGSAEYEPDCLSRSVPREEIEPFARDVFGGMGDLQIGCVHGRNTKLNALEYHKSSEVVVVGSDMVVFVGLTADICWPAGTYDLPRAQTFFVPRGTVFEMFPWCLHYAPAHAVRETGFRCGVVLPRGTNTDIDFTPNRSGEGLLLLGRNKWVLAHDEEASLRVKSAHVGLRGWNTELATL